MVSEMRKATENDLKGGLRIKSLLVGSRKNSDDGEELDHHLSIRDSLELAKTRWKKLMKGGIVESDDLTEDLKHLCKQMEISVRKIDLWDDK